GDTPGSPASWTGDETLGEHQGHDQTAYRPARASTVGMIVSRDVVGVFWSWPAAFARVTFSAWAYLSCAKGRRLATWRTAPDGHRHRGSVWRCPSTHRSASPRSSSPDRAAPRAAVCRPGAPWDARPRVHGPGPPAGPPGCAPGSTAAQTRRAPQRCETSICHSGSSYRGTRANSADQSLPVLTTPPRRSNP